MNVKNEASTKLKRKVLRKQNRCKNVLLKHEGLTTVENPTNCLFVGNGGLVCGVQRENLMEVFSQYGSVKEILMVPNKPYAFVIYEDTDSANKAMTQVQGHQLKTDSSALLYLCYVEDVPEATLSRHIFPSGLILIENFVTEEEEQQLLDAINFKDSGDELALKHRKVKHFGYEFNYSNNNVDKTQPLEEKIPDICYKYLNKMMALGHISSIPDQLTVNSYMPGQGIPPHIDTHSAFENEIISLSLGSQVIMDFYHPEKEQIPVLLPRRSVVIMTDESRYLWRHGITPRKTDVIPVFGKDSCHLTLGYRLPRTSFTFRKVRQGSCTCAYKEQCDSQKACKSNSVDLVTEQQAQELERQYVSKVYETIADHFSDTRYKSWPKVSSFLGCLPAGSIVIDAGCGNGKNMGQNNLCYELGCDASVNLAKVCSDRNLQVVVGDCLSLPFRDDCADACICIAVIHHMATKLRRLQAVKEIVRVLRPQGTALIYVWALEQETSDGPSNYLSYSKVVKRGNVKNISSLHLTDSNNASEANCATNPAFDSSLQFKTCNMDENLNTLNVSVHENRTHFKQQDVLVPWHKKVIKPDSSKNNEVYHRYYHVFTEGELESLVSETDVKILNSFYDKGNWCIIFEKCVQS